jgi:hypothetical protein
LKIAGRKIEGPNTETVVLPRGDGPPIVLTAMAVLSYEAFDKICPAPRPPAVLRRGGERSFNVEDPNYVQAMLDHGQRRSAWLVITSLRLGTPDLEWETVRYDDPNTWTGYVDELRASGLTEHEIVRVVRAAMIANALDDAKLEAARQDFFRSRPTRPAGSSSPADAPSDTPSGGPASDSDSDLPA